MNSNLALQSTPMIKDTPWDNKVFGFYTAEILEYSARTLEQAIRRPGHYTLKLNPLADKSLALQYGFYFCDTLLEPVCKQGDLVLSNHPDIHITDDVPLGELLKICDGAFHNGRFHRDPYIEKKLADKRYLQWLEDLAGRGKIYSLMLGEHIAGFIATNNNQLQLHAIANEYRGKGLAKYWWSAVTNKLFENGYETVSSSISSSHLPVLNLYAGLGFKFTNSMDIYHLLVKP